MADDRQAAVDAMDAESEYDGDDLDALGDDALDALEKNALAEIEARELDTLVEEMTGKLTEEHSTFRSHDIDRALREDMNITTPEKRAELAEKIEKIVGHASVFGLKETADAPVTHYTTRAVLAEELRLLNDAKNLSAVRHHQLGHDRRAALLPGNGSLNSEQWRAVAHLTGEEGFAMLRGEAGTGKSKVLSVVRDGYEKAGRRVLALSFTNAVVQDLRENGKFRDANTVDSELKKGASSWKDGPVVVVDEAAMLSTPQLGALLRRAHETGAKVILAGDDRQLPSVKSRGGMFESLAQFHDPAELHEVVRVNDAEQKRAFNLMHKGEFRQALAIFDKQRATHRRESRDQAMKDLVEAWKRDTKAEPEKTRLVFAYTNEEIKQLNIGLRDAYREQGRLGRDHEFETADGKIAVATGDRLQFTNNAKRLELYNGQSFTVQSIDGTKLTIRKDGAKKDTTFDTAAFKSFRHGYASTVHRGQGKTVDQAYILHSGQWNDRLSYVGLTRHHDQVALFTAAKDLDSLAVQMSQIDDRPSATKFHVDMDEVLVKSMAGLKLQDGVSKESDVVLVGSFLAARVGARPVTQHAGQKRPRAVEESGRPEERVKRLKTHHPTYPDADVVMRQSPGAEAQLSQLTENAMATANVAARSPERMKAAPVIRNLDQRPPGGSSRGRNISGCR